MEVIHTQSLTKKFDTMTAVESLNLTVNYGEIFGLVGPDGAGKTTTMRLLSTIMEPTSGQAWVAGYHLTKEAETIKANIGYMSQRLGLYSDLTVIENIEFYADIYGVKRKEREERINHLLSFLGLTAFKKRLCGNLSGGMKQKLGLACALIHFPKILLLDEPTSGVDPVSRLDFWRFLYQLVHQNVTIFISTAYLDEAQRSSRLALMHQGRILTCGTPDEIKSLMPKHILEIIVPQPAQTISLLGQNPELGTPAMFGNSLHLYTLEPAKTTKAVKDIFAKADVYLEDIRVIEPTVEDVFIWILAGKENQRQRREKKIKG